MDFAGQQRQCSHEQLRPHLQALPDCCFSFLPVDDIEFRSKGQCAIERLEFSDCHLALDKHQKYKLTIGDPASPDILMVRNPLVVGAKACCHK